ncbi:hypothetical protein XELAEV_18028345mg [Xenopus laevis]|uniref:G-protein coupled receptors family 3 profile domain-containing protein n=1 Tax=Xenopus laevis TaxID=8355 RepID=A0A974CY47_XENLA|nr:hypothetical protein XELAEV_18028345mg [Xenopus laevis]
MHPVFNNRVQFPSFYRTSPNEEAEIDGIVQILKHFGWKWVGLIISDDDTGYRAREKFTYALTSYNACIAFSSVLKYNFYIYFNHENNIVQEIERTTANVIVLFISIKYTYSFAHLFSMYKMPQKTWITSSFFPNVMVYKQEELEIALNGSLSLLVQEGEILGFKQFFYGFSPNKYTKDELTTDTWEKLFHCYFPRVVTYIPGRTYKTCTGNETLSDADLSIYEDHNYRVTYRVYTAVYALAHALHKLYSAQPPANHWDKLVSLKNNVNPWQLNAFIHNVTYKTPSGNILFFKDNGDPPARFDIVKWFFLNDDSVLGSKVGSFDESNKQNYLYINSSANLWSPFFTEIPRSLCSEPCSPGYRKSKIEGEPPCCYDCVQCGDGEMSNSTDAMTCVKCPEDQKSNNEKTECVPKALNYLSYVDTLGVSLTSTAIFLFIATSAVLGIFVKYWDTPIVKASNRNLSCLLLISLMLCFLCTLLFIGRPTKIFCLVQQVTFGVIFTISVSTVLAKTLTVIIAFNATKPGSKLKKYVGTQLSILVIFVCFLGEVIIFVVWMASSPPFPDFDTYSEADTIILMCNQGSIIFIFSIIGYIGALAVLSFIAAFLAKDFPDRFNEAKNITFSMLVFCSVWVTFVPAYLSSKGSRMVAVEIFAILSSSAGLLTCIFAPKCYIIFLRPELNIREIVVRITSY